MLKEKKNDIGYALPTQNLFVYRVHIMVIITIRQYYKQKEMSITPRRDINTEDTVFDFL